GSVAIRVECGNRRREGASGGGARGSAEGERRRRRRVDREGGVAGDRGGDRVGGGDRATSGLDEGERAAQGVAAVVGAGEGVVGRECCAGAAAREVDGAGVTGGGGSVGCRGREGGREGGGC